MQGKKKIIFTESHRIKKGLSHFLDLDRRKQATKVFALRCANNLLSRLESRMKASLPSFKALFPPNAIGKGRTFRKYISAIIPLVAHYSKWMKESPLFSFRLSGKGNEDKWLWDFWSVVRGGIQTQVA